MTSVNDCCIVDFETEAIVARPHYPPKPVAVSVRWPTGFTQFYAWGLPTGNNATYESARNMLWQAWQRPCVFHNAAFDLEVAHKWFGFPFPREWHDTMFLLFLCYPHADSYRLKETAAWLLSEPPEERDALREWILANVPGARASNFGAFISQAPGHIVGPYANGDVNRTHGIFKLLWPAVQNRMLAAYDRERRLMPVLLDASRRGVRVDRGRLLIQKCRSETVIDMADAEIRRLLGHSELNVDANEELADAIEAAGLLRPEGWPRTSTGRRSTSKESLQECVTSAPLVQMLRYRNTQATMLRTFINRWLEDSEADGRLHCTWHQTRSDDGGARTGRVSSSHPNLANVATEQKKVVVPPGYPDIPTMRAALLPEDGHLWVSADYRSQELRVIGHYEDGAIMQAFRDDPELDLHEFARRLVSQVIGREVARDPIKTVGFAQIYGAGVPKLAQQLKVTEDVARDLRDAYFKALPGLLTVMNAARNRWQAGQSITTWGGRRVPPQPGAYVNGSWRTFEYKAANMLIQGSAADQTKEAIVRWFYSSRGSGDCFLSQLYDEINVSVPADDVRGGVERLTTAMTDMPGWDVPFRAEVEVGPSWGTMSPYQQGKAP